uniref:uncharacterized protein LOC104265447 n=1 Tax=Ciona intestinalis TaxID=7719 RepID=UPI0005213719|nr:uncharacterized protein LOC104265447 [Ciona intestinalis]|eukprot:XP_009857779.1 uncharacterized protein LOC104265447 [Ciona intestinalis]
MTVSLSLLILLSGLSVTLYVISAILLVLQYKHIQKLIAKGKAAPSMQVKVQKENIVETQEQQNTTYENTSSKKQYMDINTGQETSFNLGSGPIEETYTSMSGIEDKNEYEI